MKVLLIDQLSPEGHINYDNFWIEALEKLDINYEFVGNENFIQNLDLKQEKIKLSISNKYYKKISHKNIIVRECALLILLLYIRKKIKFKEYTKVIFLSFENISIFLMFFYHKKNNLFILHDNLRRIKNPIIYRILKYLSQKVQLISLDDFIKSNLERIKIKSKKIVHPCINIKYKGIEEIYDEEIKIFSPSISSVNNKLIEEIILDNEMKLLLASKKIKLILRSNAIKSMSENIMILNNYLSTEEYRKLLNESDIILLPYSDDFNNRISGVLLEAISLEKSIILSKNNDLKYYLSFNEKNIVGFSNINELKQILLKIEKLLGKNEYKYLKKRYSLEKMKEDILEVLNDK